MLYVFFLFYSQHGPAVIDFKMSRIRIIPDH